MSRLPLNEIVKRIWGAEHLKQLTAARGVHVLGYDKWFQQHLGEFVMRRGVEMAKAASPSGEPYFMPTKGRFHWELPLILPAPSGFVPDHGKPINILKRRRGIIVERDAKGVGMRWLGGGNLEARTRGWRCKLCVRRCIERREGISIHARKTRFACAVCKVFLCKETCWHIWHDHRMCPSVAFTEPPLHLPSIYPTAPAAAAPAASAPTGSPTGQHSQTPAPAPTPAPNQAEVRQSRSGRAAQRAAKSVPKPTKQKSRYAANREATKAAKALEAARVLSAEKKKRKAETSNDIAAAMRAKKAKLAKKPAGSSCSRSSAASRKRPRDDENPGRRSVRHM